MPLSSRPGFALRPPPATAQAGARYGRLGGNPNVTQAINAGSTVAPWAASTMGGGSGRYGPGARSGSPFTGRPRERIGSAAGAVGSSGIPTSQRGRLAKYGPGAAEMTTSAVSEVVRNNGGGLAQSQNFTMGALPSALTPEEQAREQLMTDAGNFEAVQQPPAVTSPGPPKKIDPVTGLARYGRGTQIGRGVGRPIPHGQPFIAGDAKDGKENQEIILPTEDGIHVLPVDDLPQFGDGTLTAPVRDGKTSPGNVRGPLVSGRGLKPPVSGLAAFEQLNPTTPSAASREIEKLVANPKLPMPIRIPGYPNLSKGAGLKKYATGTKSIDPQDAVYAMYGGDEAAMPPSALSEITGQPDFQDGEIRNDAQGNQWRYDAAQKRGIPLNKYVGHPNMPSVNAFKATPEARYDDLARRLSGLRQAGWAQARASVADMQARQRAEEAAQRLPESERVRTNLPGGGQQIVGRYGKATIGRNVPKSFSVERMDGTVGKFNNLAEANAESAADAAQRHVEGIAMNTGRGAGAGVAAPTAFEELIGVVEPSAIPPVSSAPAFRAPLPDDRPSTVQSRRNAWGMRPTPQKMTWGQAKTRGRDALVRRATDLGTNLRTAFDRELVQPVRDFGTNIQTAWDLLTQ